MKRDIFRRGVRMQHQFGTLEERNDPLGVLTFDPRFPERPDELRSGPLEIQRYGEHQYREAPSAICKPSGGYASIQGPEPDYAQILGAPVPVGTKRRLGPLKTDK